MAARDVCEQITILLIGRGLGFFWLIRDMDTSSNEHMQEIISFAVQSGDVTPGELADAFGVNRGTVSRWRRGKNLPHTMARSSIRDWIAERVLKRTISRSVSLIAARS